MKGAIGLQTCGWIRVHDLWTGSVSDTSYQEKSGIFQMQAAFANADDVNGKTRIPFTNIFDKGCRNGLAAWRARKQLTMQPHFAKK